MINLSYPNPTRKSPFFLKVLRQKLVMFLSPPVLLKSDLIANPTPYRKKSWGAHYEETPVQRQIYSF